MVQNAQDEQSIQNQKNAKDQEDLQNTQNQERSQEYARKLSAMIAVDTTSHATFMSETSPDSAIVAKELERFREFQALLRELFPHFFACVEVEDFDGSLLMRWPAASASALAPASATLTPAPAASASVPAPTPKAPTPAAPTPAAPVLFMHHQDVVEATSGEWTHAPFAGDIADGKVWGRGVLDDKGGLMSLLQAADELAQEGFTPSRDFYFVSTRDEESNSKGMPAIVAALKERNMHFDFCLDEGGLIFKKPLDSMPGNLAAIGVGEKGCISLKISAKNQGGHAMSPGKNTPIARLAEFVSSVEAHSNTLFPPYLEDATIEAIARIGSFLPKKYAFLAKNARRLRALITPVFGRIAPLTNAMARTTIAFTMAQGSNGFNVVPAEAWVVGNMRVSHHQGAQKSIEAVTELARKYDLEVEVIEQAVESRISSYRSSAFMKVEEAVRAVFGEATVTMPYILMGASDSRFIDPLCDSCIKFLPFACDTEQLDSIHGINENADVATLAPAVDFYKHVMRSC